MFFLLGIGITLFVSEKSEKEETPPCHLERSEEMTPERIEKIARIGIKATFKTPFPPSEETSQETTLSEEGSYRPSQAKINDKNDGTRKR